MGFAILGSILGSGIAEIVIDKKLLVDNDFVCSVRRVVLDGEEKIVSLGCFNHVFTMPEDKLKEKLKKLIAKLVKLDSLYDVIIIDTGAGIADSVIEFVLSSPEVLLVVTPEPTSITDAYSLLKAVNRKKEFNREQKSIKVVANPVESDEEGQEIYEKISVVASKFLNIDMEYLGHSPQDKRLTNAVVEQKPISIHYPNSESALRIKSICGKLLDKSFEDTEKVGIAKVLLNFIKTKKSNR